VHTFLVDLPLIIDAAFILLSGIIIISAEQDSARKPKVSKTMRAKKVKQFYCPKNFSCLKNLVNLTKNS